MTTTAPPAHHPPGSFAESQSMITRTTRTRPTTAVHRTLIALAACALGTLTLMTVFRDFYWVFFAWPTMLLVVAPALYLRRERDAEPWHIWPGLALLVPWLTLVFVRDHAALGIIPTTGTWHDVTHMLSDLHHTTATKVAPIETTAPVRMVLCAMLGLLTALVDLIAVVGRHGALGGVPLLVIFTVAGAVPKHPVSWPLFVFAAIAFLMLLALDADDDLRDWGRRIPRPGGGRIRRRTGPSAQRVGLIAVAAAVVLPLLVPARHGNLIANLFHNGRSGSGGGFGNGSGSSIDPFVELRGELVRPRPVNLLDVQITQHDGTSVPFYLRVNVLTRFTGKGWGRGPDTGLEEPLGSTTFQTVPPYDIPHPDNFSAQLTVDGLGSNPPVFAIPTEISGVGANTHWSETDQLLVDDQVSKGQHLTEQWQQPTPTANELRSAPDTVPPELQSLVQLPPVNRYVTDLVATLTRKLTSPYDKARAISDYFADPANGFVYSLRTKAGDSGDELVDFLHQREGFCQQYAAAMAVMLRVAGVPSRVVLGYTHKEPDAHGHFVVTTDDAHAWVEAYFSGFGWVPFDPTPLDGISGGSDADLPWAPHPTQHNPGGGGSASTSAAPTKPTGESSTASSAPAATAAPEHTSSPIGAVVLWVLVGLVGVAVIVLVPAGTRDLRRRRRIAAANQRGDPDPLWLELADTAVDLGYVWSPSRSPRQVATWLRADAAPAAGSLETLAAAVETSRYGPAGRAQDVPALQRDLAAVTRQLRVRHAGRVRLLARLWPASLGITRWLTVRWRRRR